MEEFRFSGQTKTNVPDAKVFLHAKIAQAIRETTTASFTLEVAALEIPDTFSFEIDLVMGSEHKDSCMEALQILVYLERRGVQVSKIRYEKLYSTRGLVGPATFCAWVLKEHDQNLFSSLLVQIV